MENKTCVYNGKIAFFYRGSWYHRKKELLDDGTTKYGKVGGFATPEEAEESYYKYQNIFKEQTRNYIVPTIDNDVSLKDYIIYWYENILTPRVDNSTEMITSYTIYDLIIPNLPYEIKLKQTTTEYINILLEKIDKLGKTTAWKSRQILNDLFQEATKIKKISSNPVINSTNYKRGSTNIKILSKEEIKKLLLLSSKQNWYLEILLALFCGLRRGEIRGLKFSDFDTEEQTVSITRQLANSYEMAKGEYKIKKLSFVEKPPKTENSIRKLRIPNIIVEEIDKRKKLVDCNKELYKENYLDKDYISCREDGNPHCATALNAYLKNICLRNSIPEITVHGLRHMFATILIEQGVPIAKISALLGHSSIHTTFDIYVSVMNDKEQISAFINNTFPVKECEV